MLTLTGVSGGAISNIHCVPTPPATSFPDDTYICEWNSMQVSDCTNATIQLSGRYYEYDEDPDEYGVGMSTTTISNITIENYPCWYTGALIQCNGITSPTDTYGYPCSCEVAFTAASATDTDHCQYSPTSGDNPADSFNNSDAYSWSATAGSFKDGDSTGQSVTWIAPSDPQTDVKVTLTVKDDAPAPGQGEHGTRDDTDKTFEIHIKVFKIRCIKIEATNDVDIYWPNPTDGVPSISATIWSLNSSNFYSNGAENEVCTRKAVADVFHPATEHYTLTFTLGRYPQCDTEVTPNTDITIGALDPENVSGWTPAVDVPDETTVDHVTYMIGLAFKSGTTTVDNTQSITGFHEFDIYGNYDCVQAQFTKSHLEDACYWGDGNSAEGDIAEQVMQRVNGAITSGCICYSSFEYIWEGARGDHSNGMCCCRAKGMAEAMDVLGVDDYDTICKVNEMSEPNTSGSIYSDYCSQCGKNVYRRAWHGFWNNWEGACRSDGAGSESYAPAGPYMGTYSEIRTAFAPSQWTWGDGQYDTCPHLSAP